MSPPYDTLSLQRRSWNVNAGGSKAAKASTKPDWHGIYYCEKAVKKHTDFDSETRLKKWERKGRRVVRVGYVSTPDANSRLSRAVGMLLRLAARELEGSINAKKEDEPPQNNPLSEAMERKDES